MPFSKAQPVDGFKGPCPTNPDQGVIDRVIKARWRRNAPGEELSESCGQRLTEHVGRGRCPRRGGTFNCDLGRSTRTTLVPNGGQVRAYIALEELDQAKPI